MDQVSRGPRLEHIKEIHKDCKVSPYCFVCESGYTICEQCNLTEDFLTTDCPGPGSYLGKVLSVFRGELDFRGNEWVKGTSRYYSALKGGMV